ncbi:MAG: GNAT family N-acetyltransferase [Oscillospiraceae bacterium]|nr:GNAT family N-acetyltransferase [Oscillospiraceae bacterium]
MKPCEIAKKCRCYDVILFFPSANFAESGNYFDKGDMFWIAVDDNDRVVGSVGYNSIENTSEIYLHRLFVKPNLKHQGIGTRLLQTAEEYARSKGKTAVYVHLGRPKEQWFESYSFYPKKGYHEYEENSPHLMKRELL